jgi:hypothetical protein
MTPLRILLYALLAYFLYRFVVNFLWPVFKVSRQMRKQVREFQRHAQQQAENYSKNNSANTHSAPSQAPQAQKAKAGDYIDFEEVK